MTCGSAATIHLASYAGDLHMFDKILVPLDGSQLAEKALPYATYLAKGAGGQVLLVRALETWAATIHDSVEKELDLKPRAEAELAAASSKLASEGLAVEQFVYPGEAAAIIELVATTHDVGLIAMSTHGRSGFARWAYGSVAERVVRSSTRPILLVPAHSEAAWSGNAPASIMVPLDGSALAEEALEPAKRLARALGAGITLLQIVEPPNMALAGSGMGMGYYEAFDMPAWIEEARPYAAGVARRLQEEGFSVSAETTSGYAAATIQQVAAARNMAAIVMASHGRSGLARLAMGSVAMGVVQRATTPVLIVRPVALKAMGAPPIGEAASI
jgi:nucleotide-binding universal stress UspA family protein